MEIDVYGIGHPLVDILVEVDDTFLEKHTLSKGLFHLIDDDKLGKIMVELDGMDKAIAPGDSTANAMAGVTLLGGKAAFLGSIGDDVNGDFFEEKLSEAGINSCLVRSMDKSIKTGMAICLITPDKERTFLVYLGAALALRPRDVCEDVIKGTKIVHLTGYQIEGNTQTAMHLMELAKKHGKIVSIDLADPGVIQRNLGKMKDIADRYADIIFANEEEASEFTGISEPLEALSKIGECCDIAIVKIGKEGSYILKEGAMTLISGVPAEAVDTTGAGDMYAAAILYGLTNGLDIEYAGNIASYASAKVVETKGARLKTLDLGELK